MAIASIKFIQGLNVGVLGQVLEGVVNQLVTVENAVDPAIKSWRIELLDVGPGSTVLIGEIGSNSNDSTPIATFLPDVSGSFRVRTTVWDSPDFLGVGVVDIRNFMIRGNQFFLPPYQKDPDPLPTLASGRPTAQANETNVNGTERGWHGDGSDGLLADFVKKVDNVFPISTSRPSSFVGVTGSTGEPLAAFPLQALVANTDILLFGMLNPVFQKTGVAGIGITEVFFPDPLAATKFQYDDAVFDGSNIYIVGGDQSGLNGFIQSMVITPSFGFGAVNVIDALAVLQSIEYDNQGYVWASTAAGNIYRVAIADLSTIVDTLAVGGPISIIRIDRNGANFLDEQPRGFFSDQTTNDIKRFTLQATPAVDATFAAGAPMRALSVGGHGELYFGALQEVHRINVDLTTGLVSHTAIPYWDGLNSIDWLSTEAGEFLFVSAENAEGDIVVAQLDTATLAVVGLTRLSTTHENVGFKNAPVTRANDSGSGIWVADTHYGDFTTKVAGSFYRITPFTSVFRLAGNLGNVIGGSNTLTDVSKDFIASGVQIGDLIVNDSEGASRFYHVVTAVNTHSLDFTPIYSSTSTSSLNYEVYKPMTTQQVPLPGPKKLELIVSEWKPYDAPFVGVNGAASLGNGKVLAYYKQYGDTLDLQFGFLRGSTTVIDPAGTVVPLPPNFILDLDKLPSLPGQAMVHGIFGDALSANGGVFDLAFTYGVGATLTDLSIIPVGDPATIRLSVPIKLF